MLPDQSDRERGTLRCTADTPPIDLNAILHELHALGERAREAGICINWYEPYELRGLDAETVEEIMTLAANEYIECNATLRGHQLSLDLGTPLDGRS